jgi:hypothetical protein
MKSVKVSLASSRNFPISSVTEDEFVPEDAAEVDAWVDEIRRARISAGTIVELKKGRNFFIVADF